MHCGIILTGDTEEDCSVAFIDEGVTETFSCSTNDEIVELIEEKKPEVVALNAPPEREEGKEFRGGDRDLIDEGHAILPQGMRDNAVLERADHLARMIEASGVGTVIIETNARVSSDILGLEGDEDLEGLGVDTACIETVWEYDAVVLAVVARLYSNNRCVDHGIVVPEKKVLSI